MVDTLFFVHSDERAAEELADTYRGRGWNVSVAAPDAADALQRLETAAPVAAVFCLDDDCAAEVNALAEKVVADPDIKQPLMVFVGGNPAAVEYARSLAPYGVFVRQDELPWVLKRLVANS